MSKGIALHIGVNVVYPIHYGCWSGPLSCYEADVDVMQKISVANGYAATELKTAMATRLKMKTMAKTKPGVCLMVSF
ncbi:MAG: hypothetical protein ACJAXW_002451 [Candidatus Azotimanducaceae bacterium]|jgi:hypothetical protein